MVKPNRLRASCIESKLTTSAAGSVMRRTILEKSGKSEVFAQPARLMMNPMATMATSEEARMMTSNTSPSLRSARL